jgi:hypothetical protein
MIASSLADGLGYDESGMGNDRFVSMERDESVVNIVFKGNTKSQEE